MRTSTRRVVTAGVVLASAVAALDRNGSVRRALRYARDDVSRRVRYLQGAAEGARYRIAGRRPDPNVTDDVLTQRVRSALGPLEKQRDLPHVHVMVDEGIALLHGEVPSEHDVSAIERRVMEVSGVRSVISYLHIGLNRGTTRPSTGRAAHSGQHSPQLEHLLQAAQSAGVPENRAAVAVRTVLGTFTERIPEDERRQLLAHLPSDARALAAPPRRGGGAAAHLRTVPELVGSVTEQAYVGVVNVNVLVESVLGCLRTLVPEEANDVAAVLPEDLRRLWINAVPA